VLVEQCRELDIAIARTRPTSDQVALQLARGIRDPRTLVRPGATASQSTLPGASGVAAGGFQLQAAAPTGGSPFAGNTGGSNSSASASGAPGVTNFFAAGLGTRGNTGGTMFEKIGKQVGRNSNTSERHWL
jgi:hypothetical protein